MIDNRKTAKKLLLINWSCFQNETITLGGSTLFTGVNGTGKSTILDAMSYLITANTEFNKAANDRDRTLNAYIHGDTKSNGSNRYLRSGNVTSYIAMEFYDPIISDYHVIAVCIESRSESDRAISQWIVREKCQLKDFNFSSVENGKLTVTSRNNLSCKGTLLKGADFLGREKAVPQLTRQLGIRTTDYRKYKEKLLKMMAFNPERNVDKFLQTSVFPEAEIKSLDRLREQRRLYEQAKQMFDDMQKRKNVLEDIEQATSVYERNVRRHNKREMMFRYQSVVKFEKDISRCKTSQKEKKIKLEELIKKKEKADVEFEDRRKRLTDVDNQNHNVKDSLDKMERDKAETHRRISEAEEGLSKLKNLQISLRAIYPQVKEYISVSGDNESLLLNLNENDFGYEKKRLVFLDFSAKIKAQLELFVEKNGTDKETIRRIGNDITKLQKRIKELESNIIQFPDEAEKAKRIIQDEFNKRGIRCQVRFFAELVESLADESWRKSIETFLGYKRYNIIVDDDYCHEALSILNEKNIYRAGVVLTDKIPESEIEEKTASSVLNISNKNARRYANYLLNGIYLCENPAELHNHPEGGMTKDGMLCKGYTASKMQIQKTFLCLGNNVVKMQLKQAKEELESLSLEHCKFEKDLNYRQQLIKLINNIDWKIENYNFNSFNELVQERKNLENLELQIADLKNSPAMMAVFKEIEIATNAYHQAKIVLEELGNNIGSLEQAIRDDETVLNKLFEQCKIKKQEYEDIASKHTELINEVKDEYDRISKQRNSTIVLENKTLQNSLTDVDNAKKRMEEKQREYNILSEIDPLKYGVEFIPLYRDRYRNLANVEIEKAKNKVEKQSEQLRDVFLHDFVAELNEEIISAKEEIATINAELKHIPFGRDIYEFKMDEKADRQVFFTICKNLDLYSESPDLFSDRVSDEKLADDVQSFLSKILDTDEEEDYSDYRNYFTYDMTIRSYAGDEESEMNLSKKQGSASGGEKQTPYFIILAASLMQFYPKDVCCARIAFIDEAFSALSKERIEQMVKFFEKNNFQVFYAAPPDKIDSIGQHIDNTVSLYHGKYTKTVEGFSL